MPTYAYQCACGAKTEVSRPMAHRNTPVPCGCGGVAERRLLVPHICTQRESEKFFGGRYWNGSKDRLEQHKELERHYEKSWEPTGVEPGLVTSAGASA